MKLKIEDFTLVLKGVSVEKTFEPVEVGHEWELAVGIKKDFTATGIAKLISASSAPGRLVLMVKDGSYGQVPDRMHVMGGLLEIPVQSTPTKKSSHGQPGPGKPSRSFAIHPAPLFPASKAPAKQDDGMPTDSSDSRRP